MQVWDCLVLAAGGVHTQVRQISNLCCAAVEVVVACLACKLTLVLIAVSVVVTLTQHMQHYEIVMLSDMPFHHSFRKAVRQCRSLQYTFTRCCIRHQSAIATVNSFKHLHDIQAMRTHTLTSATPQITSLAHMIRPNMRYGRRPSLKPSVKAPDKRRECEHARGSLKATLGS